MSTPSYPTRFLHVATRDDFGKFTQEEDYFPSAYEREGFIHCCTEQQLPGVLQRYFRGAVGLRLLEIDATALVPEVKWERGGPTNDVFPHIYGKITRAAIVGMKVLPPVPQDDKEDDKEGAMNDQSIGKSSETISAQDNA